MARNPRHHFIPQTHTLLVGRDLYASHCFVLSCHTIYRNRYLFRRSSLARSSTLQNPTSYRAQGPGCCSNPKLVSPIHNLVVIPLRAQKLSETRITDLSPPHRFSPQTSDLRCKDWHTKAIYLSHILHTITLSTSITTSHRLNPNIDRKPSEIEPFSPAHLLLLFLFFPYSPILLRLRHTST